MTSLEIAIIVAIVLVIAVAVGWYLYTTFVASTATQGRLSISNAEYSNGQLRLYITNPGPQPVTVKVAVLNGEQCTELEKRYEIGKSDWYIVSCSLRGPTPPGTMVPGYIVTTAGTTFPFNAIVR
jgi:hypothetical protein